MSSAGSMLLKRSLQGHYEGGIGPAGVHQEVLPYRLLDPNNYDLVINTANFETDTAVKIIKEAFNSGTGTTIRRRGNPHASRGDRPVALHRHVGLSETKPTDQVSLLGFTAFNQCSFSPGTSF